ncbi:unnamed protein product, partial [Oppiella nova]
MVEPKANNPVDISCRLHGKQTDVRSGRSMNVIPPDSQPVATNECPGHGDSRLKFIRVLYVTNVCNCILASLLWCISLIDNHCLRNIPFLITTAYVLLVLAMCTDNIIGDDYSTRLMYVEKGVPDNCCQLYSQLPYNYFLLPFLITTLFTIISA